MFLVAGIGITLPISVIGLGVGAAYSVWLMLTGFPIGWGIAMVIYCLWYMGGAYRMMTFLNGQGGVRTNAGAAACLPSFIELLFAFYFMTSNWPPQLSAFWALLLPLTFLIHLLLQGVFEFVLGFVNPSGKRQ